MSATYDDLSLDRPPSLLTPRRFDPSTMGSGATVALGLHVVLPITIFAIMGLLRMAGLWHPSTAKVVTPHQIVAAKFVKLGKPFDPRHLPNRNVPHLSTAPPPGVVVSKNMNPVQHDPPDAAVPPPNPTLDAILRIGDRAQTFAEIAPDLPQEGDVNGIAEGTETHAAQAGDLYAGKLFIFFHRGWSVPTTISEDEAARLVVTLDVEVKNDLHIGEVRVANSSGNELFDQSTVDRINALKASNATIPEPPPEIASQYVGLTMGVRFSGGHHR